MAKRVSGGRVEQLMKSYVDNELQAWRKKENQAANAGEYMEVSNVHNPSARWRQYASKHFIKNVSNCTNNVLTISGAINAAGYTVVEPQAITVYISSSLSSSIYVDKIGIAGTGYIADPNYFYSSSLDTVHPKKDFISGSRSKILAFPARKGTPQYTEADLINAGYHTSSCDITITLNDKPATNVGNILVYFYYDKFWAAF